MRAKVTLLILLLLGTYLKVIAQPCTNNHTKAMITASNKVSSPANVHYKAENAIIFTPGFESRAVFKAEIQDCPYH